MKRYSAATLATVALALGVWIFFYVLDPEMPLDSADMFVVVADVQRSWSSQNGRGSNCPGETVGVKNHS